MQSFQKLYLRKQIVSEVDDDFCQRSFLKNYAFIFHKLQGTFFLENGKIEPILQKFAWSDGTDALRDALQMEKHVSGNIKNMIDSCDGANGNDYFSADWLTGTW